MAKISQLIFKLKDQTIALIALLLFFLIIAIVHLGWQMFFVIIGMIIFTIILTNFLLDKMVKLIAILRRRHYEK